MTFWGAAINWGGTKRPSISARALASAYGLEELRAYRTRSRHAIEVVRQQALATAASV